MKKNNGYKIYDGGHVKHTVYKGFESVKEA